MSILEILHMNHLYYVLNIVCLESVNKDLIYAVTQGGVA